MVRVIIADSALGNARRSPFLAGFLSTLGQVEGNCSGGMVIGLGGDRSCSDESISHFPTLPIARGPAAHQWGLSKEQLAEEYNLSAAQIDDALALYAAHQSEMDGAIALESAIKSSVE